MLIKAVGTLPVVKWDTNKKEIYKCNVCDTNLENKVFDSLGSSLSKYRGKYSDYMILHDKGRYGEPKSVTLIHPYTCSCGENYEIIFSTEFNALGKFPDEEKEFFISYISGSSLARIDGLYPRVDCQAILEKYLMRWKYSSRIVYIAYPFVGNSWSNNDADKTLDLWDDLVKVLNDERALIITRAETFKTFKLHLASSLENYDELVKNNMVRPVVSNIVTKQNFHAKFYAAIFENRVEVLVGSHNIHGGDYIENFMFKEYSLSDFIDLYAFNLDVIPMPSDPDYKEETFVIDGRSAFKSTIADFKKDLFEGLANFNVS